MKELMINHPRLKVQRTTGAEGPKHDPYHYEEWDVKVPGFHVILHEGLAEWLSVNGVMQEWRYDVKKRRAIFATHVGYTLQQILRIYERLSSRCSKCGGTDFTEETGYPGEYFNVCCDCGHIQSCFFNESEVM